MEKETVNKEICFCINCGIKLQKEEGRGVNEISIPESQKDFFCPKCWDRIGQFNYSEYE